MSEISAANIIVSNVVSDHRISRQAVAFQVRK